MRAVWTRVRAELRNAWRAWLSLALILGIAGGFAIAAAAGARRTITAYPRFLERQDGFHAMTGGGPDQMYGPAYEKVLREIESMPEVRDVTRLVVVGGAMTIPAARGLPERTLTLPEVIIGSDAEGAWLYEANRAKVLEGRLPDRAVSDETSVPFIFAERYGIRIGDRLLAGVGFDPGTFQPLKQVTLRVVGVHAAPGEFDAVGQMSYVGLPVTPAFLREHAEILPPLIPDLWNLGVHLREGPSAAAAFKRKIETTYGIDVPATQPTITAGVQKTMRLYSVALWLLAALVAIAAFAVFGQTLSRQAVLDSGEYPTLRALGLTRRALFAIGMVRALVIATSASVAAVAIAFALSPLTPIGSARMAEPDPGFTFDAVAVGIGAAGILLVTALLALVPAWRNARSGVPAGGTEEAVARPSMAVRAATQVSSSPSAATGLRMALEPGRGRSAVPVRSTILAVAIGIAAVTGSVVVGRSLTNLLETPSLTGFTYDAIVPNDGGDPDDARATKLRSLPIVAAVAGGTGINISVGGRDSFLISFEQAAPIGFSIIDGRAPRDALSRGLPEIALAPATMRRTGADLGDVVAFEYPAEDERTGEDVRQNQRAIVVGKAAVPSLPWAATEPGEGAVMSLGALETFTEHEGGCCFVRFKEGTDLAVARATLAQNGFEALLRTKRADLQTLERITILPAILALAFAAIALAALVHVLVSGVRRRRRDLAILKTIGFVASQVRSTIAWQASAITLICLVVGIPFGVALGRWGWRLVADEFGVVPVSVVPSTALILAVPAALVAANVIALAPARAAARTEPALVLRSE